MQRMSADRSDLNIMCIARYYYARVAGGELDEANEDDNVDYPDDTKDNH